MHVRLESLRPAENAQSLILALRAARYRFAGVEFHIPRNIQVRQPVTVIVQKNGSGGPQAEGRDAGPPGLLTEGPVSVIPKEETAPVAGDVDVIIAVAVIVGDRDTHAPTARGQSGLCRHIRESSVMVIMVERAN